MRSLSEENWKNHIVYLTRERPKTGINGLGGYLVKMVHPFDIEDIKNAYGGYEFSYIMKKGNEIAYSGGFSIEASPKFDPAREQSSSSIVSQAPNSDAPAIVQQVMSLLREQLEHNRDTGQGSSSANEAVVKMLSDASEKAVEAVSRQVPSVGNPATMLKDMVVTMKEMGLIGGSPQKSSLASLLEELSPLIALLTPVLGKFFTPQDPLSQVTQFMGLMDKLDELRGKAGGGSKGATTNDLIIEGMRSLPGVLQQMQEGKQTAAQIAEAQRARAEAQRATAERLTHLQQIPQTPGTAPLSAPARPSGAPAPRPVPPAPGGGGPLATTPINRDGTDDVAVVEAATAPIDKKARYDQWIKIQIYEMVSMELDGGQIADFIDTVKPDLLADLRKFSAQEIEMMFALDPILAEAIKLPGWAKCILEAKVAAAEMLEDEEEVSVDEPKPVMAN